MIKHLRTDSVGGWKLNDRASGRAKGCHQQKGDYAVVAITKHSVELARKLGHSFQNADVYYMNKFQKGDEGTKDIQLFTGSVRLLLPALVRSLQGSHYYYFPWSCCSHDCAFVKG